LHFGGIREKVSAEKGSAQGKAETQK